MYITFLGTSSGMPTKQRNVSGIALGCLHSKAWYLIDCGEATQHQLLHTDLSLATLEAIFITHIHGDHCYGLPGLLATAGTRGREQPLTIVGPKAIKQYLDAVCEATRLQLPYPVEFHAVEQLSEPVQTRNFLVTQVELSHRVPSFGYVFVETFKKPKLDVDKLHSLQIPEGPLWGKLQRGENVEFGGKTLVASDFLLPALRPRRVIISGDNDRPELYANEAKGVDVLVHEATYTDSVAQKVEPGPQHSSALQVARFAESAGVPNLILTHFSQRYHNGSYDAPSIDEVRDEAARSYSGQLFLANDFDTFHLAMDGRVFLV